MLHEAKCIADVFYFSLLFTFYLSKIILLGIVTPRYSEWFTFLIKNLAIDRCMFQFAISSSLVKIVAHLALSQHISFVYLYLEQALTQY